MEGPQSSVDARYDFDSTFLGFEKSLPIILTNASDRPLAVKAFRVIDGDPSRVNFTGDETGVFRLTFTPNFWIESGETRTISVRYVPDTSSWEGDSVTLEMTVDGVQCGPDTPRVTLMGQAIST